MNRKKSISSSVAEKEKTERGKRAHSGKASLNSGNSQSSVKLDIIIKSKSASQMTDRGVPLS